MHSCPSCAAPLDDEGVCTSCGALSRGFFRGLDLGAPQIAAAVAQGLDFYLLLGVPPTADVRSIARRYRQLRVLFPDDPSSLVSEPARRLALLEQAGRVLTDPRLRGIYDELRISVGQRVTNAVLRCAGCAAPLPPDASCCPFCATPRPAEQRPPVAPPLESGPPAAEPVDYYAMLGLTAEHLVPALIAPVGKFQLGDGRAAMAAVDRLGYAGNMPRTPPGGPPPATDIDSAALAREQQLLLARGYTAAEREERVAEIEIARRILRNEQLRSRYDMLLLSFRQGLLSGGRLDALRQLQDQVRADIAQERGEQVSSAEGAALLKQGVGYLDARLPREAIEPLRRAVGALPGSTEAHAAYARAILSSDDPLALGAYALRQALSSLEALGSLGAAVANAPALTALCRGLLARDQGDAVAAAAELARAVGHDSQSAPAWRGLAALAIGRRATEEALGYCGRALAIDPRDERALTMAAGACLRSGRRDNAREFAARIAALRGEGWTADAVIGELVG
jgi:curved DNA-binding protein CbpA